MNNTTALYIQLSMLRGARVLKETQLIKSMVYLGDDSKQLVDIIRDNWDTDAEIDERMSHYV